MTKKQKKQNKQKTTKNIKNKKTQKQKTNIKNKNPNTTKTMQNKNQLNVEAVMSSSNKLNIKNNRRKNDNVYSYSSPYSIGVKIIFIKKFPLSQNNGLNLKSNFQSGFQNNPKNELECNLLSTIKNNCPNVGEANQPAHPKDQLRNKQVNK